MDLLLPFMWIMPWCTRLPVRLVANQKRSRNVEQLSSFSGKGPVEASLWFVALRMSLERFGFCSIAWDCFPFVCLWTDADYSLLARCDGVHFEVSSCSFLFGRWFIPSVITKGRTGRSLWSINRKLGEGAVTAWLCVKLIYIALILQALLSQAIFQILSL